MDILSNNIDKIKIRVKSKGLKLQNLVSLFLFFLAMPMSLRDLSSPTEG